MNKLRITVGELSEILSMLPHDAELVFNHWKTSEELGFMRVSGGEGRTVNFNLAEMNDDELNSFLGAPQYSLQRAAALSKELFP